MYLVHQMGKVGSTAIVQALKEKALNAVQTHYLSEDMILENVSAYLQPHIDINRILQEKELFFDQLIATKYIINNYNNPGQPINVITSSREPFDRWMSALTQNYTFHLQSARKFFNIFHHKDPVDDYDALDFMIQKLFSIIDLQTLVSFREKHDAQNRTFLQKLLGSWHPNWQPYLPPEKDPIYRLGSLELKHYYWDRDHMNHPQASQLLKSFGAELIIPFYWFENNLKKLLDIDIYQIPIKEGIGVYQRDNIRLLYIQFETLKTSPKHCEQILSDFCGQEIKLKQSNVSRGKPGYETIKTIKQKYREKFQQMKPIQLSTYCQHFNYNQ